ncbi:hypothetical protein ABTY20_34070 [Streptomyces sp. NPDC126497]|uniref:hypothetical protein n=1 Tax=Streptomyces sp. NPDC126497 TaxID=3155313 RepID=UPI0033319668
MASWWDPPCFTGAGRAAPALAEGVPRLFAEGERACDALYGRAAGPCGPKALATSMSAIGRGDFLAAVALVAEPVPGRSFTGPWK